MRRWLADSLAAAAVVSLLEIHRMVSMWPGDLSIARLGGIVWTTIGLVGLGGAFAGPLAALAIRAALRTRIGARWWADIDAGAERRVVALVRAAFALAALAGFAAFTYALAAWAHRAFLEPRPIALLECVAVSLVGTAILVGAVEGSARLAPLAARAPALIAWSAGRRGLVLAAAGMLLAALSMPAVAQRAAPDAELRAPVAALGWFLLVLALLRFSGSSALGRARRTVVAGAALSVLTLPLALRWADAGRHAVWSLGAVSRPIGAAVLDLFDRDGDGYASALVGAADCDDGDAAVRPVAAEIPGDGRDQNCNGHDPIAGDTGPELARAPVRPSAPRLNLLVLTIDTIRADHVGAWGYARPTTPNLDALAARSTRFAWAFTTTPTTRWALRGVSLGRYSSSFGWTDDGRRARHGRSRSVAETLAAAGYETRAIMCCPWPPDTADMVLAGMAHSEHPAASPREKEKRFDAREVAARTIAFLSQRSRDRQRPFFLWVHFIDPHNPYERRPGAPDFGDRPIDRYDSEIAHVDARVGEVLAALERLDLAATTAVAVASDHGEEFGDHGRTFHGRSLYNEVIRIPILIHVPGAPAHVVETPVSLADLAPTLADLAGAPGPIGQNGRSLADVARGTGPAPTRPILTEVIPGEDKTTRNLLAVISGCDKLIWDREANTYELYSLCDDPGDRNDRSVREPEALERYKRLMAATADVELASDRPRAARNGQAQLSGSGI